jgi:hypothetical protein
MTIYKIEYLAHGTLEPSTKIVSAPDLGHAQSYARDFVIKHRAFKVYILGNKAVYCTKCGAPGNFCGCGTDAVLALVDPESFEIELTEAPDGTADTGTHLHCMDCNTSYHLCECGNPSKETFLRDKTTTKEEAVRRRERTPKPGGSTPGQYALAVETVHHGAQHVECGEVIDALKLNFNMGEVFKADWRLEVKPDAAYNLRKIIWFAHREQLRRGLITVEQFIEGTK